MGIESLLEAIKVANSNGVKRLEVSMDDLQALRHEVLSAYREIEVHIREKARLQCTIDKLQEAKKISLDDHKKKGE